MTRVIYVNGEFKPYASAMVHVEDRGFQFADGVYEVCEVRDGALIDERKHLLRLERSMRELKMRPPMTLRALGVVMREAMRRNRVRDGVVYLQVTRGAARRDFLFPAPDTPPSVVCYARRGSPAASAARAARGLRIRLAPDIRWRRPDIKTIGLLPNSLAKQEARESGADDAWFYDGAGLITEGASNNAWIVTPEGALVTRPAEDNAILRGVTREVLLSALRRAGIAFEERPFSVAEAKAAREAFLTSASAGVMPVVMIDGAPVGDGAPGPLTRRLRERFYEEAETSSNRTLIA